MKKNPRADALMKVFTDMMQADGNVLCKECSTENWQMYHTPGNPCPLKRSDAAHGESKETK